MQLLFWASLGGLLLWWLIDLTRLGHLVRQHNQRALSNLIDEYHDLLEERIRDVASRATAIEPPAFTRPQFAPAAEPPPRVALTRFEARLGAVLLLSGALVTAVALYVFYPPPLFPH